ncbi:sensor histidine kinase [Megasphaera vaginalis (ex Srinivasan et al. 2021)]|uniref:histidine kinase n=1 Tax=Megasphaera vaginalis (ex Srinivasan et al. 2021) TaxID=1111454 RepID=U7UMK6_9FIRM|nr:ATP-binding protein [Megasphaera vaginalis (ex Srinivasan et al. 2021)]ERT60546.1 PAS domain S-box protein [Megasphaera vaginalis (ex Srinivasan et al. 2021)]
MKRRVYFSLLLMGILCIFLTAAGYSWVFWQSMEEQSAEELRSAIACVSVGLKEAPDKDAYLAHVVSQARGNLRITWIDKSGDVLYESDYDKGKMENHMARPEVKEAIATGSGMAIRDSQTLSKALYYTALRLDDQSVLRVSTERNTLYSHLFASLPILITLIGLTVLACVIISHRLMESLLEPLRRTARIIERINLSSREAQDGAAAMPTSEQLLIEYDEIQPLIHKIVEQGRQINADVRSLEQQKNTVRLMMENLTEAVVLTDKDANILGINGVAKQFLNVKQHLDVCGLPLPKIFPEVPWQQLLHERLPDDGIRRKFLRQSRQYELIIQRVYDDGEFYGVIFIVIDVTERERREQLRREFTSNVTHELKTPLTSISGFAEVLSAGLYQSDADVHRFGRRIHEEAQRLLGMIQEVIHLSHIEEGRKRKEPEKVVLKELAEDIINFISPLISDKQVTVHCQMEAAMIWGDKALLRELLMNLIDNAVKYNRRGGHVYINIAAIGGKVLLTVRDTGIGIPEDKQQQVFERFYRVDDSRSQKIGGSGLGLAIVKHIAEQHQGQIRLQSREAEGTEISILFPAAR